MRLLNASLRVNFPRSYVDANREPYELDPAMFEGPLPRPLNHRTTRVAAGLGKETIRASMARRLEARCDT